MTMDSARTKKRTERSVEADCFEDGKFAGALADGNGHGVAGDEEQSKEDHAADGENQELNVSKLLGEIGLKGGFRFGFRFVGGVGK